MPLRLPLSAEGDRVPPLRHSHMESINTAWRFRVAHGCSATNRPPPTRLPHWPRHFRSSQLHGSRTPDFLRKSGFGPFGDSSLARSSPPFFLRIALSDAFLSVACVHSSHDNVYLRCHLGPPTRNRTDGLARFLERRGHTLVILALNVWLWATSVLASACDDECLTNHALTINHWMNGYVSWSPVLSAARHGRFMPGQPSMQIAAHTQTYNRCCQGPGVGGPKPRCSTSMPSPSALSAGLTCYHGLYIGRQLSQPMD